MKRLEKLFAKQKSILNIYCTAGFPKPGSTMELMLALQENGANIIELGMPYSDPLADGPVIQESNTIALKNGMTIHQLFKDLRPFRNKIHVPVILMGYLNPVLQYGFEKFCTDAATVGVDGFIIPDLPDYEFEKKYKNIIHKNHLDFIFLITPETNDERILHLDKLSSGFLYAVSAASTTGSENEQLHLQGYLQRLQSLQLKNPVLVGFGIRNKENYDTACQLAAGAIIGSAYIRALMDGENVNNTTKSFLSSIIG